MPYEVAIPAIEDALRDLMEADTDLTSLIAKKPSAAAGGSTTTPAIYNDGKVPAGATMPYVTLGAWTQVGFHSLSPDPSGSTAPGGYGWNCTGQFKVIGQRTEAQVLNVMSQIFALFEHGKRITVSGYGSAWCDEFTLQPTLKTTLAGVTTFEAVGILRVFVHDT